MVTDGLLECGTRPLESGQYLYDVFTGQHQSGDPTLASNVLAALHSVHEEKGAPDVEREYADPSAEDELEVDDNGYSDWENVPDERHDFEEEDLSHDGDDETGRDYFDYDPDDPSLKIF